MVEGTLDIFRENALNANSEERFALIFARYVDFKSGAQAVNRIVGFDGLESYLLEIGLVPVNAKEWASRLRFEQSVSINNVMLAEEFLPPYAN